MENDEKCVLYLSGIGRDSTMNDKLIFPNFVYCILLFIYSETENEREDYLLH